MGCSSTSCDPAYDDDDFTAVAMCCSCGGGSTMPVAPACSDTDNGAVNSVGASCGVCSLPSEVPSHVLGRGGFDFSVSMRVAVDGVFQTSGKLAAFVGNELRGVATPSAVPFGPLVDDGTVLFQVSVWAAQTEVLTWKFCDGARMVELEPPCSFTDAEVAIPPFRPMCTGPPRTFAAGWLVSPGSQWTMGGFTADDCECCSCGSARGWSGCPGCPCCGGGRCSSFCAWKYDQSPPPPPPRDTFFGGFEQPQVAQYFNGTASHCTIRAPHRAEYGDEDSPIHFISAKTDAAVPDPYP